MSKPNKLIPELRFHEFEKAGKWEEKTLDETCDVNPSSAALPSEFVYIDLESVSAGKLLKRNKIDRDNAPSRAQRLLNKGDIIFQMVRPYQKNNLLFDIESELNFVASTGYAQLRAFQSGKYLYQYLHTDKFVSRVLSKSTGSNYPAINTSSLSKIRVEIPKPKEQQKIASCLSSLDDLIVAQSDKLQALKDHKKGLMQNLFPQDGKTVPKYRFSEFEKDGEWAKKSIEQIAKVTTGNKDTQNKVDNGMYPFFVRSQTVERINSYSFDGEAILTSGDGVGVGKNFHYINGKFDYHQRVYCIYDFAEEANGQFVFMYFSQHFYERVMRMSAKNSVDSVRMAMITEMPIYLPSKKEQKKIASCLSAVDELITAQADKIEQLQQHKKGLMQGLFPKFES